MTDNYLTVSEAAQTLKVHEHTVRRLITTGELRAHRIGDPKRGTLRIAERDLNEYLARTATDR